MSSDLQEISWDEAALAGEIHLDPVEKAIEALRSGLPVLVVDDADRENEGDVIMAAVHASPEWVGWTIRHTRACCARRCPTNGPTR